MCSRLSEYVSEIECECVCVCVLKRVKRGVHGACVCVCLNKMVCICVKKRKTERQKDRVCVWVNTFERG